MIRRGDVWWASLPAPAGSEPGFRRPLVIVSADSFNRSRIRRALGVALTTNLALADAPGNVALAAADTGLPSDSVADVSQVATVDRLSLTRRAGALSSAVMQAIDDGLRIALGL